MLRIQKCKTKSVSTSFDFDFSLHALDNSVSISLLHVSLYNYSTQLQLIFSGILASAPIDLKMFFKPAHVDA